MTNYGQTSKELEEEYEKEEEPFEQEYIRTFPKKHSSSLPRARLCVKIPNSMDYMGGFDSIRMTIPKSDIFNKEWRNFNTRLFGKKKRED
jgi:hypothetical protein